MNLKNNLKDCFFPHEVYLVSFDIKSLFTNVPVQETLDIVINSLFEHQEDVKGIGKNEFKKLLNLCVNDNHFIFNKQHYMQHEGFAMGSPLSAPMANIFLCFHEQKWLENCPNAFKPLMYRRNVDDTFLIFRTPEQIEQFFHDFNNVHRNIQFTKDRGNCDKFFRFKY